MMRKQNKGPISSPCKLGKFGAVNHSDITNLSLRARQDKLLPTAEFYKWVVLRRELGGNAVDEKSVTVGIGVGYREHTRWAKKSTPPVWGGRGGGLKNHLSCTVSYSTKVFYGTDNL